MPQRQRRRWREQRPRARRPVLCVDGRRRRAAAASLEAQPPRQGQGRHRPQRGRFRRRVCKATHTPRLCRAGDERDGNILEVLLRGASAGTQHGEGGRGGGHSLVVARHERGYGERRRVCDAVQVHGLPRRLHALHQKPVQRASRWMPDHAGVAGGGYGYYVARVGQGERRPACWSTPLDGRRERAAAHRPGQPRDEPLADHRRRGGGVSRAPFRPERRRARPHPRLRSRAPHPGGPDRRPHGPAPLLAPPQDLHAALLVVVTHHDVRASVVAHTPSARAVAGCEGAGVGIPDDGRAPLRTPR
mmetsp:Transcript_6279/g.22328  ORF Transcript_6279/g.22328 Transcript_6279/m.22328 type:complete len:303 (+) Transcript_6279:187-1095(+)